MRVYSNRSSSDFIRELRASLSMPKALDEAVPLGVPFERDGVKFTHLVRVDYMGIAATTLFDEGQEFVPECAYAELVQLFESVRDLNQKGCFVRLRLLLQYPYSIAAYSRIQAEWSSNRSSVMEPSYTRNFGLVEQVDRDRFMQSYYVRTQTVMLEKVQELMEHVAAVDGGTETSQNKVMLRFTPIDTEVSCTFVNSSLFYDPYTLAKLRRAKKQCAHIAPVVGIDSADGEAFHALEDHFRYLWELDATLDYEDATQYEPSRSGSLAKLKEPGQITYEHKAMRTLDKNPELTEEEAQNWKASVRRVFERFCCNLRPTPDLETVFITCSWETDSGGTSAPHRNALILDALLSDDFNGGSRHVLDVRILKAPTSEWLSRELYGKLDSATIGLVLMTVDIRNEDGAQFCRPNVYHELGYLMKQLGPSHIALICEDPVVVPSDVRDLMRIDITSNNINLVYPDIVQFLHSICAFKRELLSSVLAKHKSRLDQMTLQGEISNDQLKAAVNKINGIKGRLCPEP